MKPHNKSKSKEEKKDKHIHVLTITLNTKSYTHVDKLEHIKFQFHEIHSLYVL